MKPQFLLLLGAVASRGAAEILAQVTCDTKLGSVDHSIDTNVPNAESLAEVTNSCIEDVCADAWGQGLTTKACGAMYLTVTYPSILPVGPTSLSSELEPIPQLYAPEYAELRDGTKYLSAGPSLKAKVPLNGPDFVYGAPNTKMSGSLSHAGSPNERLAIAIINNDKYIFAYTALKRQKGIEMDQLRRLIDTFLQQFAKSSIAQADTALNLDGGGSIFVAWRKRGFEQVIARGSVRDDGPPFDDGFGDSHPREVANYLKLEV